MMNTLSKPGLDPIEHASRDEIEALQLQRLKWTLAHAYNNVPHYKKAFDEAGVHPDDLKQLSDIAKFPFFHPTSGSPVLYLSPAQHDAMLPLLQAMEQEMQARQLGRYDVVRSHLLILLTQLRRLYPVDERTLTAGPSYPLVKRFTETPVVVVGMMAAIVAFAGIAFIDGHMQSWLYVYIVIGAASGLAAPAINGVLSRQVPDNAQGELQGAVNAANSLATIIGPLAATQIFAYFTYGEGSPGYFPGAPFLAAAILITGAVVLFSFIALRFDLGHKPSIAVHPRVPEMSPPGQMHVPNPNKRREQDEDVQPPI